MYNNDFVIAGCTYELPPLSVFFHYQRKQSTQLGYKQYHCRECGRQFDERAGTSLNFIEYPTEVVILVVYHYTRLKLSLDDVVELMATRGFNLSH